MTKAQKATAISILEEIENFVRHKPIITPSQLILQRVGPTLHPVYKKSIDGRIIFGVGFLKYISDDWYISIEKWHVINQEGIILSENELTDEEMCFINSIDSFGPPFYINDLHPFSKRD